MGNGKRLSSKDVFFLWLPLAATWLLMAFELPMVQGLVARLTEAKLNLAAFGLAIPILFFIEAPIYSIITAANALVKDRESYYRLRNFTWLLSGGLSLLMLLVVQPLPYRILSSDLLHLSTDLVELSRLTLYGFVPSSFVVAYRRFYQGILIQAGENKLVGISTAIRLAVIIVAFTLLLAVDRFPGAQIGALALTVGLTVEAVTVRFMAWRVVERLCHTPCPPGTATLSYAAILKFYLPLALTTLIFSISFPLLTCFLSHAPLHVESLAVFPLVYNLSFFFGCLIFAMQEVIISRIGEAHTEFESLQKFTMRLALYVMVMQSLILLTPVSSHFVFFKLYSLSPVLGELAEFPAMYTVLLSLILAFGTWQRAVLIHGCWTKAVTVASTIEVICLTAVMAALVNFTTLGGITCAMISLVISRALGAFSLRGPYARLRQLRATA